MTARSKFRLCLALQFAALAGAAKGLSDMIGRLRAGLDPTWSMILLFGSVIVGLIAAVAVIYYRSASQDDAYNQTKVAAETLAKLANQQPNAGKVNARQQK